MTAATVFATDPVPKSHREIAAWVDGVADLTSPDQVVWCDGSDDQLLSLTAILVNSATLVRSSREPNSFWCASDFEDVAYVEDGTYVCTEDEADAGPTNKWMDPVDMKTVLTEEYRGAMTGRTMYVIAFCGGPLDAAEPLFGVQITDSAYVAVSMQIMTRSGTPVWDELGDGTDFMRCLHSVGAPLRPGQADVPWPCDHTKYIAHFPDDRAIWSYGSGYGGNVLPHEKRYSLRVALKVANDEGWLADHMSILEYASHCEPVSAVIAEEFAALRLRVANESVDG